MKKITLTFLSIFFLILSINLLCTPSDNVIQNTDIVDLIIDVPEKTNGFKWCKNDNVIFNVTIMFPHLVKNIAIEYGEAGKTDNIEITTDETKNKIIKFNNTYLEEGIKEVVFTITFRESVLPREKKFSIDIGLEPTILNEKVIQSSPPKPKFGEPLTLSIEHQQYGTATYKWYKNFILQPNNNKNSYLLAALNENDSGEYYCHVQTDWGEDQSEPYTINLAKILEPPVIINQLQNLQVTEGNKATFTIYTKGNLLTYQWQKNQQNIAGANDSIFNTEKLKMGDDAIYRCIVSNKAGVAISNDAQLNVFENSILPKIILQPISQVVNEGDKVRFLIRAEGTDLQHQWFRDDKIINNATAAIFETEPVTMADNGTSFHCVVSNNEGDVISEKAKLSVKKVKKPVIKEHPKGTTVKEGEKATFKIIAEGINLQYQWQINGEHIINATTASYITNSLTIKDNENKYCCIVKNPGGEVKSEEAILIVTNEIKKPIITEHPLNLVVTEGNETKFLVIAQGLELSYQWQKNKIDIIGADESEFLYKDAKLTDNGALFRCVVSNTAGSTTSEEGRLTVHETETVPVITVQPENITVKENEDAHFSITATGTNLLYQWYRNDTIINNGIQNILKLDSVNQTYNNSVFRCIVKNSIGEKISTDAILTVHYGPEISKHPKNQVFNPGKEARFTVEVNKGNPGKTYFQWYEDGFEMQGKTSNELVFPVKLSHNGKSYACKISNDAGYETISKSAILTVHYIEITKHPQSVEAVVGDTISFNVSAKGNPNTFSYQWKKDSTNVGENSHIYTISHVDIINEGKITCIISNGSGYSVTSNPAQLTVKNIPPEITLHPQNKAAKAGDQVTFLVKSKGTNLKYQWLYEGSMINGATQLSYRFIAKRKFHKKKFSCMVSNSEGTETSNSATLTVYWPPIIETIEKIKKGWVGKSGNVIATIKPGNPKFIKYIWKTNIGDTLSIGKDCGFYFKKNLNLITCTAFNDAGSVSKSCQIEVYYLDNGTIPDGDITGDNGWYKRTAEFPHHVDGTIKYEWFNSGDRPLDKLQAFNNAKTKTISAKLTDYTNDTKIYCKASFEYNGITYTKKTPLIVMKKTR